MRQASAIFFVSLYLIAMLRPVQPYVEYILNQDYIAEFLCINKDKPKLQCNGKCHLAKQIEKQKPLDSDTSFRLSMENYPIGFVEFIEFKPNNIVALKNNSNFIYLKLYNFSYSYSKFKPPTHC